eukprot:ctg_708.g348
MGAAGGGRHRVRRAVLARRRKHPFAAVVVVVVVVVAAGFLPDRPKRRPGVFTTRSVRPGELVPETQRAPVATGRRQLGPNAVRHRRRATGTTRSIPFGARSGPARRPPERLKARAAHLAWLQASDSTCVIGGAIWRTPTEAPADAQPVPYGSLLLVCGHATEADVRVWLRQDPYAHANVFAAVEVFAFQPVIVRPVDQMR